MTHDQLNRLVNTIIATWPTGPRAHIWTSELANRDLDADRANTAYTQLRANDDKPPSIARFLDVYRALESRTTGWQQPTDTGPIISPQDAYRLNPELNAWRQQPHPSRR